MRGLFLLVEFDDVKFQPESDSVRFTRQLNEEGFADDGATGSARDYFISQSYGLFTPTFDVVGPIHLPHNEGYYGANQMDADINPGQMVIDACQLAHDSLGVDFGNYDFDDDGVVDFVFILYAGYGENYGALPSTIWPHMSKLTDQRKYLTLDGKNFDLYACSCELRGTSGTAIDGIGAFCHEFGHVLGLPDIYDTFNSRNLQLGAWDIMDAGSYNNLSRTPSSYTGYERYCLGWLDMVDLTEPADSIILPEINESRVCYRIATRTDNEGEFFTLENHQQQGWDAYQPASGMMIIHIDYEASIWHSNTVNSGMHPRVDLVEADGTPGAPTESDLFPTESNNSFTDYSNPNSLAWDKTPTERGVDHIRQEADGTISFRFMRDRLFRPIAHEVTQLCDTSFVGTPSRAPSPIVSTCRRNCPTRSIPYFSKTTLPFWRKAIIRWLAVRTSLRSSMTIRNLPDGAEHAAIRLAATSASVHTDRTVRSRPLPSTAGILSPQPSSPCSTPPLPIQARSSILPMCPARQLSASRPTRNVSFLTS